MALAVMFAASGVHRAFGADGGKQVVDPLKETAADSDGNATETGRAQTTVSWLGRFGPVPISILVIILSIGPAVAFTVYKRKERRGYDEWGHRLAWKIDASD